METISFRNTNSDSKVGVHKYTDKCLRLIDDKDKNGETLVGCMGGDVKNQNDFITRLEVGDIEEKILLVEHKKD